MLSPFFESVLLLFEETMVVQRLCGVVLARYPVVGLGCVLCVCVCTVENRLAAFFKR